jgi:hypothetical protein
MKYYFKNPLCSDFFHFLWVEIDNLHAQRNCTKFLVSLSKPKSKNVRKVYFLLDTLKLDKLLGSERMKVKNSNQMLFRETKMNKSDQKGLS